jgi:hypothetical protein
VSENEVVPVAPSSMSTIFCLTTTFSTSCEDMLKTTVRLLLSSILNSSVCCSLWPPPLTRIE